MRIWLILISLLGFSQYSLARDSALLNVSYDPTRELYQQYNQAFASYWHAKSGDNLTLRQSHGGSGRQAVSVMNGIEADVVTLALAYDIDAIAETGRIASTWIERLPYNSAPYTSTIVFLVREGNPKNIRDWDDLIKPGVKIITPNPKTSGGARWNYLAAWGYGIERYQGDEEKVKQFVKSIFDNVSVFDTGARGAANTFIERNMGDVLIAWENEALLAVNKSNQRGLQIIIPSRSILAEPTVAVVDRVVDRKGTREVAQAYLEYLYSPVGQEIAAQNFYRPRNSAIAEKYSQQFPHLTLFTIDEVFGGWQQAHQTHFAQGAIFDQITRR